MDASNNHPHSTHTTNRNNRQPGGQSFRLDGNPEEGNMDTFIESLAYEQEVINGSVAIKEKYDKFGNYTNQITDTKGYGYALLEEEGADEYVIRRYTFHTDMSKSDKTKLYQELGQLGVTHLHRTTKGFVVFSLRDEVDGKMVARDWGDFNVLEIREGDLSEKLFKRLSVLGVRSYFYGTFNLDDIKIKYIQKDGAHVDGEVYISQEFRGMIIDQMLMRAEDEGKALELAAMCEKTWTFSTFRALVADGFIKGDAVVTRVDHDAHIIVYTPNKKAEIKSKIDDKITVTMMPQKQGKSVRTNRQIMSMLGESLYSENLKMVKDAFSGLMQENLEKLEAGTYIPEYRESEEFDAISGINDKVMNWHAAGLNLRESRYLTGMMFEGIVTRYSPDRNEDKKRRFPVPYAKAYSIRSEHTYEMVYGEVCPVPVGGVFIDKDYGVFVSNSILEEFLEIAGGGDLDDKVENHVRIASHDDEHFGVKAGQVVGVFTRNPMGANSDGLDNIGVEYQVRPIYGPMVDQEMGTFHEEIVPSFDMLNRPLCINEVESGEGMLSPTPQNFPDTYSKEFAWKMAVENIQDPFGGFVNVIMAFVTLKIPFPFYASGETVVDICQQTRAIVDMVAVEQLVETLRKHLLERILEDQIVVDEYIVLRAGIQEDLTINGPHLIGEGIFTNAVTAHREIVADFELNGRSLVHDLTSEISDSAPVARTVGNLQSGAWMDMKIRKMRQELEHKTSRSFSANKMSEAERNELGNYIYDKLMTLIEDDSNNLDYDGLLSLVRDMYHWAHTAENGDKYPEKVLYYGDMFMILTEALSQDA